MDKETPVTKYLAMLERRQNRMDMMSLGSPSPGGNSPRTPVNIRQRLRFDDQTFLQPPNEDQSVFHFSPPPTVTPMPTTGRSQHLIPSFISTYSEDIIRTDSEVDDGLVPRSSYKRKRYSFEDKADEDEEMLKKISDLERLLRQTQADLVESRAITSRLEHQKMELSRNHTEKLIHVEKSQNEMRIKCRDAVEKAEELQKQMDKITKKHEEVREQLNKQTDAYGQKMSALEARMSKMNSENAELKQKYEEDKLNQSDSMRKASFNLEESEKGAEKWVIDCQILKDQLSMKEDQLTKYQQELKEVQTKMLKCEEIQQKNLEPTSPESQSRSQEEKLKNFENLYVKQQNENNRITKILAKLSEENSMLKTSMKKEMLLEEQITTLESEVKYLRETLSTKMGVEAERDSLQEKLLNWTTVAEKTDPNCTTPYKLEAFIRTTQSTLFEMKHENTNLKCTVDSCKRSIGKLETEIGILKQQEKTKTQEHEQLSSEFKQMSRKLLLLTKDRDGLKCLKESYEQELEGIISVALKDRVKELEGLIIEYEKVINEDPSKKSFCQECDKRMALISNLRSELEKAQSTSSQGNDITMSSDGNTTGVKIISFGMNPSTLSTEARIKELSAENEVLKTKLKQYDEQSILGPSDSAMAEEKKKLEEQLRTLERKYEILTEAYDYETQQLQTALTKLFGFHVTLAREPQSQLRLQSVYSQSPDELFIFQEAENNDMMLLETPILDSFRDDIERFLINEGSIPAFLSSVTISFAQGQSQHSVDTSQIPNSQQSNADAGETVTVNNPRMVQVEIEGESDNEDSEEDEEEVEDEDVEDEEEDEHAEPEEEYEESEEESEPEHEPESDFQRIHEDSDNDNDVVTLDSD